MRPGIPTLSTYIYTLLTQSQLGGTDSDSHPKSGKTSMPAANVELVRLTRQQDRKRHIDHELQNNHNVYTNR
jgi:hypothetical protein